MTLPDEKILGFDMDFYGKYAAVDFEGNVHTNVTELSPTTDEWNDIEQVWIVDRFSGTWIFGKKNDGTVLLAFDDDSVSLSAENQALAQQNIQKVLEAAGDLKDIFFDYDDDVIMFLHEDGTAGVFLS